MNASLPYKKHWLSLWSVIVLVVSSYGQTSPGTCVQAMNICSEQTVDFDFSSMSVDCDGADGSCSTASDWSCFASTQTVWLSFVSNASGGQVNLNLTADDLGAIQAAVITSGTPCDPTTFQSVSCFSQIDASGVLNFTLPLPATTYYVMLNNSQTAVNQNVSAYLSGPGVAWSVTTTGSALDCNGDGDGSVSASVNQGAGGFSFLWDDPFRQRTSLATNLEMGSYSVEIESALGCDTTATAEVTEPDPFDYTVNASNADCPQDNGTITVTMNQGTGYTFNWLDGVASTDGPNSTQAAGLAAGAYQIEVTGVQGGGFCTDTILAAVNDVGGPTVTSTVTNVQCYGGNTGSVVVQPDVNSTFNWSNGPQVASNPNLTAGTYTVTVTAVGGDECKTVQAFQITEPEPLVVVVETNPSNCGSQNGSATADATGGTQPYARYNWTSIDSETDPVGTTATNTELSDGTYSVLVEDDAGCFSAPLVFDIAQAVTTMSFTATPTAAGCGGQPGNVAVTNVQGGAPPYFYSSDGVNFGDDPTLSDLPAGNYTITVRDGSTSSCEVAQQVEVPEPEEPEVELTYDGTGLCGDDWVVTAVTTGGTGPFEYAFNGGSVQSSNELAVAGPDTISVDVFYAGNCFISSSQIPSISTPDPCEDLLPIPEFSPNEDGINDSWRIIGANKFARLDVKVFTRWGQPVYHQEGYAEEWDGTALGLPVPNGMYYYAILKDANDRSAGVVKGAVLIMR